MRALVVSLAIHLILLSRSDWSSMAVGKSGVSDKNLQVLSLTRIPTSSERTHPQSHDIKIPSDSAAGERTRTHTLNTGSEARTSDSERRPGKPSLAPAEYFPENVAKQENGTASPEHTRDATVFADSLRGYRIALAIAARKKRTTLNLDASPWTANGRSELDVVIHPMAMPRISVAKSSGSEDFDRMATQMLISAAESVPVPSVFSEQSVRFSVVVEFLPEE